MAKGFLLPFLGRGRDMYMYEVLALVVKTKTFLFYSLVYYHVYQGAAEGTKNWKWERQAPIIFWDCDCLFAGNCSGVFRPAMQSEKPRPSQATPKGPL
jgi:hypothetical protein